MYVMFLLLSLQFVAIPLVLGVQTQTMFQCALQVQLPILYIQEHRVTVVSFLFPPIQTLFEDAVIFLFVTSNCSLRTENALLFMASVEVATRVKTCADAHMLVIGAVRSVCICSQHYFEFCTK